MAVHIDQFMENLDQIAFIERDGKLILHALWRNVATGEKEWRRVPTVVPAEDETLI